MMMMMMMMIIIIIIIIITTTADLPYTKSRNYRKKPHFGQY